MRRFTKGSVAFSGWITVAVTVSALTGCAPSTPLDTVGDDENVAAVQAECPTDLITDTEWGLGPSESHDLSVIEDALGVSLPTGVGCVLTVGGDTQDSTAYYVFWPNEGASLAESIGQAMLDSGYQTGGGDLSFSTSGATAQVYAYAAGEGDWSEYFDESEVVLFFGQFDGQPGKVTSAAPDAGTGQTLTWESSCMLTVDELS